MGRFGRWQPVGGDTVKGESKGRVNKIEVPVCMHEK
jgi:hypothetical protein